MDWTEPPIVPNAMGIDSSVLVCGKGQTDVGSGESEVLAANKDGNAAAFFRSVYCRKVLKEPASDFQTARSLGAGRSDIGWLGLASRGGSHDVSKASGINVGRVTCSTVTMRPL